MKFLVQPLEIVMGIKLSSKTFVKLRKNLLEDKRFCGYRVKASEIPLSDFELNEDVNSQVFCSHPLSSASYTSLIYNKQPYYIEIDNNDHKLHFVQSHSKTIHGKK